MLTTAPASAPATPAEATPRPSVAPALWAAVATLAPVLLLYHKIVYGPGVPGGYDTQTYFFPYREAVAQALRSGHFPLWDSQLFLGAPLFANIQAAVLYPPNVIYLFLSTPRALAASLVLHVWWAAWGMALLCRRTYSVPWPAAIVGGALFGLGGFFSAQAGHVNQVDAAAWLPWLLLSFDLAWQRRSAPFAALAAVILALQFLAGHTQESYFILATTAAWAAWRLWQKRQSRQGLLTIVLAGAVTAIGGAALAAVQLVPTLELAGQSIRRTGLTMAEASSFSWRPDQLLIELLPGYAQQPESSEYIAYIGAIGLLLALVGVATAVRRPGGRLLLALVVGSLALAFGIYDPLWQLAFHIVPGFSSFRVPARWLYVTTFGLAALAALGAARLWEARPRRWPPAVVIVAASVSLAAFGVAAAIALGRLTAPAPLASLLIAIGAVAWTPLMLSGRLAKPARALLLAVAVLELVPAGSWLELNQPVPSQVYSDQRQTVAFLRGHPELGRALSLADSGYVPGDTQALHALAARTTGADSAIRTEVAAKLQDVLNPNLPLAYGVRSVDGYDGGILPLANYVALKQAFLPPCPTCANPDALLHAELTAPLPLPWLRLLGVGAVIDDRLHDFNSGGVAYDTSNMVAVAPGGQVQFSGFPTAPATSVGILTDVQGARPANGTPVAMLTAVDAAGRSTEAELTASVNTDAVTGASAVQPQAALAAVPGGHAYLATIALPERPWIASVTVRSLLPSGEVEVRALSLVDSLTHSNQDVTVAPAGSETRVLRGDLDIYTVTGGGDPAFVATTAQTAASDAAATALLRQPSFPLDRTVVLSYPDFAPRFGLAARVLRRADDLLQGDPPLLPPPPAARATTGSVRITQQGDRTTAVVTTNGPAYLVLKQAWYPGWRASVDGRRVSIYRADLAMQAVPVPAGTHTVVVTYRPGSLLLGSIGSMLGAAFLLLVALLGHRLLRRVVS